MKQTWLASLLGSTSSNSPVYRQGREGVQQLRTTARQPIWLMGSESCLFIRLSLQGLPRHYQSNRIAQRVKETSPFSLTGYQAKISGDIAEVWLWDKEEQQAAQQQGISGKHAKQDFLVIPEFLLMPPVQNGFARRSEAGRTVLEKWQEGTLEGYRSFARTVDQTDLDDFQRTFGQSSSPWQSAEFTYLNHPRHLPLWWEAKSLTQPGMAGLLLFALGGCALLGGLGNWVGWELALSSQRGSIQAAMETVAPQLAARDAFLRIQSQNDARGAWLGNPEPLAVAAEFEYLVGELYSELLEWDLQGSSLKVVIKAGDTSSRRLLESLQKSPLFKAVRAEPGLQPGSIVILAELAETPATPFLFASEQAASTSGEAH